MGQSMIQTLRDNCLDANPGQKLESSASHLWAVLLAGGDGSRLRDLTRRIARDSRPKRFCRIVGGQSLFRQTGTRLGPLFLSNRQVFVMSRAHERYYREDLTDAGESCVIEQPLNRGTGILWNTFVTVGRATSLFEMLSSQVPEAALAISRAMADNTIDAAYAPLEPVDFSRAVLANLPHRLLVLRDRTSGWADLGSPGRVLDTLSRNGIQPEWATERDHVFDHQ
jgi:hypothetical protein